MIRVLLVDDQALVRAGLRLILTPADDFVIVGECADGDEVLPAVSALQPALVVMDVRMPRISGVDALQLLQALPQPPPVLMLTTFADADALAAALERGAAGFILKDAPADDLLRAARMVARGGAWLDAAVTGHVITLLRAAPRPV